MNGNSIYGLKIYPNPANEIVNVKFNNAKDQKVTMELISIAGQQLRREEYFAKAGWSAENINVAALAEGIYFLRIISEKEVSVRKLLIERD